GVVLASALTACTSHSGHDVARPVTSRLPAPSRPLLPTRLPTLPLFKVVKGEATPPFAWATLYADSDRSLLLAIEAGSDVGPSFDSGVTGFVHGSSGAARWVAWAVDNGTEDRDSAVAV